MHARTHAHAPRLPVVAVVGQVQLGPDEQHLPAQHKHAAVVQNACRCARGARYDMGAWSGGG